MAGIGWTILQNRTCEGVTQEDLLEVISPDIEAYNRREKESFRIDTDNKNRLIEILKKNQNGWFIPWDTPSEPEFRFEFSRGSKKVLTVGFGSRMISRGWCFKKLSVLHFHQLKRIATQ